jgi:hypothetical protein
VRALDSNSEERRRGPMLNNYEVAEIVEVGKAHDVILGSSKLVDNVQDSPFQDYRETIIEDDE